MPTPGPSKAPRLASPSVERMDVDPPVATSTGRDFSDEALTTIDSNMRIISRFWKDDVSDIVSDSNHLSSIYSFVQICSKAPLPVDVEQFKKNVTKERESFANVLRMALKGKGLKLWHPVVTHDVFHIVIPDDLNQDADDFHELKDAAIAKSWETPFIGTSALAALKRHVVRLISDARLYGPFCSIVQSSGMGKSRLLDEFSKYNFVIPINLRNANSTGFPPPDNDIRDLLTQREDNSKMVYVRMLVFLSVLFEKTEKLITNELKEAENRSERITKFREFMSNGQTRASAGEQRKKFYRDVADSVEDIMQKRRSTDDQSHADVKATLTSLIRCLGSRSHATMNNLPHVFVVFDEAHTLTERRTQENRTFFTELFSAVKTAGTNDFFSFFLSTTSKISQFAVPKDMDQSLRMAESTPPVPFSDLGFDHLMRDRKIFEKFKTIDEVASNDCVMHMGRPLWGSMYDCSDPKIRGHTFHLAVLKLLFDSSHPWSLSFTAAQYCAVLSQRLAIDINSTTYLTGDSTRNFDMTDKVQAQIANHMRVCIAIPKDLATVRGIAASEPLLSEAASYIMRNYRHFDLCDGLLEILGHYAVNLGEQGELLVAALFTWARDSFIKESTEPLSEDLSSKEPSSKKRSFSLSPSSSMSSVLPPYCSTFSVKDLLSKLFKESHFKTMLQSRPSVCRADFSSKMRFGDVFGKTKMHFNHMLRPIKLSVITRPYLLAIMARGAAAFGAPCQRGYDMVYPFLYDSSDLIEEKVGFILVQVKNLATYKPPDRRLFKKMDPFVCNLLREGDSNFTIPIIRIVFSIDGGGKSLFRRMEYKSPEHGSYTLDAARKSQFTSYDFWCSGLSSDVLRPVINELKWKQLMGRLDRWNGFFLTESSDVRCSQYPGGGIDDNHYDAWMDPVLLDFD